MTRASEEGKKILDIDASHTPDYFHPIRCARRTGTYADILEAIGIASLIEEMGSASPPFIAEDGGAFQIQWESSPASRPPGPGYPYIWVSEERS